VPDVIASTANYLASLGWRRGEPWLQEVRASATVPWDQADLTIQHPRAQWAKWGVTLPNGRPLPADNTPASLLLPMGRMGPAFLAYENFQVYLKWNQSLVYSATAGYFATRLSGAPPVHAGPGEVTPLNAQQIGDLQRLLNQHGFEAGEVDGKLGSATRTATKKAQMKLGLAADSYPNPELLERLRRM
jgi:hypothetical protein